MSNPQHLSGLDTVTPDDQGYAVAITRWAANAERKAAFVVYPADNDGVAQALRFALGHTPRLLLAVRGGGHSAAGSCSIEGGIVIDLSRHFDQVRVDAEKKRAYVGGGATWASVDQEAIKHGLAAVGGTVSHTGVGGLTLGGGYGWLSGQLGLVVDNLVQATVVKADGTVVAANVTSNSDLFWALRGAGSNFGIVTEFVFQLHEQRNTVTAGSMVFAHDKIPELAVAVAEWYDRQDPRAAAWVLFTCRSGKPIVSLFCFFNGTEQDRLSNPLLISVGPTLPLINRLTHQLTNAGPLEDHLKEMTYDQVNSQNNSSAAPGIRRYMKGTGWTTISSETLSKLFSTYCDLTSGSDGQYAGTRSIVEFIPFGRINSVSPANTSFPSRGRHGNYVVTSAWTDPSRTASEGGRHVAHTLTSVVANAEAHSQLVSAPPYSNYLAEPFSASATRQLFGEEKYKRLQEIKKKYDPQGVFCRWFPIET